MAAGKEIRNKIKSVQNTRKITKAMEMVAASKMSKAQERMRAARPYGEQDPQRRRRTSRTRTPSTATRSWSQRDAVKRVGIIVVTTDKGLCGGLNTNVLRAGARPSYKELEGRGRARSRRARSATRAWASCSASARNVVSQRRRSSATGRTSTS